jgi:hypothetical protein
LLDLLADSGRRDVQFFGRAGEGAVAGGGFERLQGA